MVEQAAFLVTGGCGFMGTNFIRYILNNYPNCLVFNLDLGPERHYAATGNNLKDIEFGEVRYCQHLGISISDAKDTEELSKALNALVRTAGARPIVVVHFASETHVTRSESNPSLFYETNFFGTIKFLVLLKDALERRPPKYPTTLIHISTDEVYGEVSPGVFCRENQKEPGEGRATSPYSKSKALADDFVLNFSRCFSNPRIVIARPTNNFGPWQFPEKMLARNITRLLRGKNAIVWGEGKQVRDWLFMEDTAKAICLLSEKGEAGTIYNIGANHKPEIPNAEIIRRVVKMMGLPEKRVQFIEDPRPQHDFRYAVDTTRIRSLGWKPGNFEEQLAATIKWYQNHASWWEPLLPEAERIYKEEKKSG